MCYIAVSDCFTEKRTPKPFNFPCCLASQITPMISPIELLLATMPVQRMTSTLHPLVSNMSDGSSNDSMGKNPALELNQEFGAKPALSETPLGYLRSMFPEDSRRNPYYRFQRRADYDGECDRADAVRAVRSDDVGALRKLLADGTTAFDACNRNGESLLHLACRRCGLDTVKFLVVEAGISPEVRDNLGRTVLHDVCWRPRLATDIMDFLVPLVHPELLLAEDMRGHTPFDYSRRGDWVEWNRYLEAKRELIELRIALST